MSTNSTIFGSYDPNLDADYMAAIEALKQHSGNLPQYQNSYSDELSSLYQQIVSRPAFSYDMNADALYKQYKDSYIAGGTRAMRDTMAQAAALTGGYGSSYAQSVGQQQYGVYMQDFSKLLPELYDRALDTYDSGTERLMSRYELTQGLASGEYQQYQNELDNYNQQLDYLADQAQSAYDRGKDSWQQGINERDEYHKKLTELMEYSGYVPTDDDLKKSGMTREQADAYLSAWKVANPLIAYLNGVISAEEYFSITGAYPVGYQPAGGGGGWYGGSSKKKEEKKEKQEEAKVEPVDKYQVVYDRAKIEADYNAGRIDYDDRERLVNQLYGW